LTADLVKMRPEFPGPVHLAGTRQLADHVLSFDQMNEHAFSTGHLAVVDKFSHETNSSHRALKLIASGQYPFSLAASKIVIGTPLKGCCVSLTERSLAPPFVGGGLLLRRWLSGATEYEYTRA
jgi:hypothetical protein